MSSVRTRFLGYSGASSLLNPKAFAAWAKAEDDLAVPGDFGVLKVFPPAAGLTGCLLDECIDLVVLVIDGTCRGPVGPAVVRAHRRHIVLRAARAADSIEGAMESAMHGVVDTKVVGGGAFCRKSKMEVDSTATGTMRH